MNDEIRSALIRVAPFLIVLMGVGLAIHKKRFTIKDLSIQRPNTYRKFFTWWILFVLFMIITEVTLFKNGILEVSPWKHNLPSSIIRILGMVVLAPVAEELLFRGIFITKLMQWKLNKHTAIAVQAFVFILLHSFTYQNTLTSNIGISQSLIDATLYAYARFNTQSIYTPIAMHATGNLIAVLEQFIL